MSRSLRAQVSLIFSDEDLFDNFVTPLKENKELSGMIVRLLTAYYNSEEVRNLIEGVSFDDAVEGADQIIDSTEAINQMRQTLAMQDFLFEQARQTLDDGASEMDALMKANDIAKQSGVVKTEATDVGEALVKLSLGNPISDEQPISPDKPNNGNDLEGRVGKIEEVLNNIMSMLQSGSFNQSTNATSSPVSSTKTEDEEKTPMINEDTQVPVVEIDEPVVSEPIVESNNNLSSEVVDTVEDSDNSEIQEEDASSMLGDVLKDLLG